MTRPEVTLADGLKELDDWCKRRLKKISARSASHVMSGLSIEAPNYRLMLGEHRAYTAVRSYIHGSRAALTGENKLR